MTPRTMVVDLRSPESIRAAFASIPGTPAFDVIVEDGLHECAANETFLRHSWANLSRRRGIYVIEGVSPRTSRAWPSSSSV